MSAAPMPSGVSRSSFTWLASDAGFFSLFFRHTASPASTSRTTRNGISLVAFMIVLLSLCCGARYPFALDWAIVYALRARRRMAKKVSPERAMMVFARP